MTIAEMPERRDLVGIGLSDSENYATRLSRKLGYVNTFPHKEPRFDIAASPQHLTRRLDFIIASEVFDHTPPPVSRAFVNARQLLRPSGILVFSAPYSLEPDTREYFPELCDYRLDEVDGNWRMENRTALGQRQVFTDLVFDGRSGSAPEMRLLSRDSLIRECVNAGFAAVRIADEPQPDYGIVWPEPYSIPMVAYAMLDR